MQIELMKKIIELLIALIIAHGGIPVTQTPLLGGSKTPISNSMTGKTAEEQSLIKASAISKLNLGTFTRDGITVEVQSIKQDKDVVEILARAWKGTQLGFGDGSIDIERFRFKNTLILVEDPLG